MKSDYRVGGVPDPAQTDWVDPEDDEGMSGAVGAAAGTAPTPAEAVDTRACAVPAEFHAQRLDRLLVSLAPEFSRNHLQTLVDEGHVSVDGVAATSNSRKLRAGQQVVLALWPTQESRAFRPEPILLNIVFEDAALLVVDKPAGMVVHPAAGNWSGTLLNALLAHHPQAASLPRAGIVHRLDKDTSGLMVVGKTLAAVTALSRAIAAREVHREYLAIAHGHLHGSMRIDAPIGRDLKSRVKMAVVAGGRQARTDVVLVAAGEQTSAVRCILHTGRTHQIRVHLASRGHPLVADVVYGGRAVLGVGRQALHATQLRFSHPITGQALSFDAGLPVDLQAAWDAVLAGA
jgi:23S rRNA pseudouridine1911/1915/1917 synthase